MNIMSWIFETEINFAIRKIVCKFFSEGGREV